jgi:hypothetical protein
MAKLTEEQLVFLHQQGVPLSRVYDATGMSTSLWKHAMKLLGMDVAYGVTPCDAEGHTLRTRYGHCVQCGTHNLAFMRRFEDVGWIYIAESAETQLVKLGVSTDVSGRIEQLNYYGYGGCHDWGVVHTDEIPAAGRVEFLAHQLLDDFRVIRHYEKDGNIVECRELFECDAGTAEHAVKLAQHQLATQKG